MLCDILLYRTWGGTKPIDGTDIFVYPDNIDFIVGHGYVVSNAGAKKLLEHRYPVIMPVDCYMAQHTHYKGNDLLNGVMYNPPLIKTMSGILYIIISYYIRTHSLVCILIYYTLLYLTLYNIVG